MSGCVYVKLPDEFTSVHPQPIARQIHLSSSPKSVLLLDFGSLSLLLLFLLFCLVLAADPDGRRHLIGMRALLCCLSLFPSVGHWMGFALRHIYTHTRVSAVTFVTYIERIERIWITSAVLSYIYIYIYIFPISPPFSLSPFALFSFVVKFQTANEVYIHLVQLVGNHGLLTSSYQHRKGERVEGFPQHLDDVVIKWMSAVEWIFLCSTPKLSHTCRTCLKIFYRAARKKYIEMKTLW